MKRVRVAPGKFVMIGDELAQKSARLRMPTKVEFDALAVSEPKGCAGPLAGEKHKYRRKARRP